MKFHLQFPIPEFNNKINYQQKIFFVGSCFAENIGNLFSEFKLNTFTNSHGIQYNPWNIVNSINKSILNKQLSEEELFFANELWNSWEHHSKFSNPQKSHCLDYINTQIKSAHHYLLQTDWLIITLGSSYVYKYIEGNQYVANCHKVPQKQFSKHLLNVNEMVELFETTLYKFNELNKNIKIIFTVSPVRYIRDGIIENTRSKARLIETAHSLIDKFKNCYYFPAYEIIMDDLRDYRFFEEDLVHPNETAINYVFEKFVESVFDDQSKALLGLIKEINTAKSHKPVNSNSKQHKLFKKTFLEKCNFIKTKYPFMNLENEINFFSN